MDDISYSSFCLDVVIPCLTALAIAVKKDNLWKQLNHTLLMMTRDKKKIIRIISVKALHRLFTEVPDFTKIVVIF